MEFLLVLSIIAGIAILGAALFFGRIFLKRVSLRQRVMKVCRQKEFTLCAGRSIWWLGWTKGKDCDFSILTQNTAFSVKLIGCCSRRIYFHFIDPEHYAIRNLFFQFSAAAYKVPYDVKKKEPYDFVTALSEEAKGKQIVPIILMNPVSATVTSGREGDRIPVNNGDLLEEGRFFTATGFLKMLATFE